MLLCLCTLPVHAETVVEMPTEVFSVEDEWFTDEELLDGYAMRELYGYGDISMFGVSGRELLGTQAQKLYDYLLAELKKVAVGERTSTVIEITPEWMEQKGFTTITTNSDSDVLFQTIAAEFGDTQMMLQVLLQDAPYDLYWFDKTTGVARAGGGAMSYNGGWKLSSSYTFSFSVSGKYRANGNEYEVTTTYANSVKAAAKNAADIVAAASGTDEEILRYFADEIMKRVTYDKTAAESGSSREDTSPWNIINVFDGDESTNVVCEGYAKAFQYLCDLKFGYESPTVCYTATGMMAGGTGAGPHMWNIVKLNGKYYLVDVTNSEKGTIGEDGSLLLAKAFKMPAKDTYVIENSSSTPITFTYDQKTVPSSEVKKLGPTDATIVSGSDTVYYMDIDDALAAWTAGSTLNVLENATVDGSVSLAGGNYTLNLGGKTLTAGSGVTGPMVTLKSGALTITDAAGGSANTLKLGYEGGTLTLDANVLPDNWQIVNSAASATVGTSGKNINIPAGYSAYDGNGVEVTALASGKTYTIAKEKPLISIAGATITVDLSVPPKYNGTPWKPQVTVTLNGIPLTKDTDYTIEYSNNVNAGEATITVTGIGNYTDTATGNFTIALADSSHTIIFPTNIPGLVYNGSAQVLIEAGESTVGTMEYSLDSENWSTALPTATEAGSYTVYYRVEADNYEEVFGTVTNVKIVKAEPVVSNLEAKTLTYTGAAQALVSAGSTTGGTLEYKLDDGEWSTTIPTGTDAGSYTVYYRVTGDNNYKDVDEKSIDVTIGKADPTVTDPEAKTLTYTGAAQELVSAGATTGGTLKYSLDGTNWSTDVPIGTDAGSYKVYYRVTGDKNYESVAETSIDVTIGKAAPTVTDPEAKTLTYTGAAQELVSAGSTTGGTLKYSLDGTNWSTTVPTGKEAGNYTVHYQVVGDDNFSGVEEKTLTVTIQAKAVTITGLKGTDRAYNGDNAVTLTGGVVDGAVAGDTVTVDLSNATATMADANAGNGKAVTVTGVALSGDAAANYELTAQPTGVTVNITPAELTLTAATIRDQLFSTEDNYTLEVTDVTFAGLVDGETLTAGNDYTATAEMTGANVVDTEAAATVTVTLTNPNYTLVANTVTSTVKLVTHSHEWAFTGSGDTITATCSGTIGTCPADGTATIQLGAPADLTYNGTAKEATVTQSPVNTFTDLPAITYSGNATDAGSYTATLTYQGATATVDFTIAKADLSSATITVEPATFTYNGTAKEPAATVKLGETTLIAGTDYTITYADNTDAGTATVTVTGTGNYKGTASQTFTIEKAALTAADFTFAAPANLVYDGNAKAATVTTDKTGAGTITISYMKSGAAADPIDAGSYTVAIDVAEGGNYQAATGLTSNDWAFTITAAGTDVTAQADKAEYIYGETVTVTASRAAKRATFALRTAPAADQMALFLNDVQVSDAVDAVGGTYTMTIDTSLKELAIGDNTLTVKYVSNGNLSDATATVTVKLLKKELTITDATATSRVYKTDDEEVAVTAVTLSGVITPDVVAADLTGVKGTLSSDAAGTYTSLILPALSLTGADAGYYSLTVGETTPTNVEIQKITLTKVTAPSGVTLPSYVETAEAVAQQLPATIGYSNDDGAGLDVPATWTCDSYDATPGKTNTFTWTVDVSSNPNYAMDAGVATSGTAIVTNAPAVAVNHTGTDATITFANQPYNVAAMFTVDANAGAAQYAITGGTGEGTLSGTQLTVTKVGTFTIGLTTEAKGAYAAGSAKATLTVKKGVPAVTAPSSLTATYGQTLNDVTLPTAADGTWAWVEVGTTAVGDAGQQTHQVIYTPADTTNWETVTLDATITVAKQGSNVTDITSYLDTTETDTFTYGETITVKVKIQKAQTFALRLRTFTPPAKDQMALFIGDRQISEPASAVDGVFTLTVDTTDKDLKVGSNKVLAKYVGNDNVAPVEKEIEIVLNRKQLTVNSIEAEDRAYQPGNQQVVITAADMSGILGEDDVTAAGATATVSSADADTYSEATLPQKLSLSGEDADYYEAEVDVTASVPVSGSVTITPATPEPSPVTQGKPEVPTVTQPGKTLADVPLTLPAGSYNVPGTIQWISDPTTPVERGKAYEWVFIPDDPNYAPVTGSSVIYPAGDPPVVTSPTETQTQSVPENGAAILTMNAKGATTYQWYVNRNDGNGYLPIDGATSASCNTGALHMADDGNTYYCKVTNQFGEAITPIYIVHVMEAVVVPQTGDNAQLGLWYALMAISVLALGVAFAARKRSKG